MLNERPRGDVPELEYEGTVVFDTFARRAGAALRSPAPVGALDTIQRRARRVQMRSTLGTIGTVGALLLSAIALVSRQGNTPPAHPTVETNNVPSTVPASDPSIASPVLDARRVTEWYQNYTGNPIGPVSGPPVRIGAVMPDGLFRLQLNSTATFLNDEAGGIGGRPVELAYCNPKASDCAEQFATDPSVVAVLENAWGDDSIGTALRGRKPLHTTYSRTGTSGVAYYPMLAETTTAMALEARSLTEPGQQVVVIDARETSSPAGPLVPAALPDVAGMLPDRLVTVVTASRSAQLIDSLRAAGVVSPAVVIIAAPPVDDLRVYPLGHDLCLVLAEALRDLAASSAVIAEGCPPIEGWYQVGAGYNETAPTLQSGALPILERGAVYGGAKGVTRQSTVRDIGALLAVIRIVNQVGGPARSTPEVLSAAMRAFTGPLPVAAGGLDCTDARPPAHVRTPGSCVAFVDVHQFVNGVWIDRPVIDLHS